MISGFPISARPIAALPLLSASVPSTDIIGRWGPDETKEERQRRHDAGLIFQHEELPVRSEFTPEPVKHPPHEPQELEDEPAVVNKAKLREASPEYLAEVLSDVPDDIWNDTDVLNAVEAFAKNGTRR